MVHFGTFGKNDSTSSRFSPKRYQGSSVKPVSQKVRRNHVAARFALILSGVGDAHQQRPKFPQKHQQRPKFPRNTVEPAELCCKRRFAHKCVVCRSKHRFIIIRTFLGSLELVDGYFRAQSQDFPQIRCVCWPVGAWEDIQHNDVLFRPVLGHFALKIPAFVLNFAHNYRDLHGIARNCTDLHGLARTCTDLHGLARTRTGLYGLAWNPTAQKNTCRAIWTAKWRLECVQATKSRNGPHKAPKQRFLAYSGDLT